MRQMQRVSREAIFAAADELAERGDRPTLEAVRKIAGGSFTTLGPALREWRERKEQEQAAPPARELPEALRKRLEEAGTALWADAVEQADRRVQTERDALRRERQGMDESQAELGAAADTYAARNDELEERCAALEQETRRLREELQAAREAQARAMARADTEHRLAAELREQLAATRQSLCADLAERVQALERAD